MPKPTEHKTVQSRILQYAQEIGWKFVPRAEAEQRRHFDPSAESPQEKVRHASLFFEDLLYQQVRQFNPLYTAAPEALAGQLRRLPADIHGNREMLTYLRNAGKFFSPEEKRERDLILIDYRDIGREAPERRNVYEATEEFY
jgi:type I restriction enzyme R subunit